MEARKIFVISGPSGVGKTTLIQNLIRLDTDLERVVTCTTRPIRSNEKEGIDYFFSSKESFISLIDKGLLIEWEEIYNHYYGSLKSQIAYIFSRGLTPILTTGVQGASALSALYTCVLIFIEPPSSEVLEERLLKRGEEDKDKIKVRLKNYQEMMSFRKKYNYTIVCNDFSVAFDILQKIVNKEKEMAF